MFEQIKYASNRLDAYEQLAKQLHALVDGEPNLIANLSNASALLNQFFDRINWVGFYLVDDSKEELVLGPFQGLPACIRIPFGRGVCGTVAKEREAQIVPNVHEFPGHIACDAASQSEIVLPIIKDNKLLGVLDIDSPELNRFDAEDLKGLEQFIDVLVNQWR